MVPKEQLTLAILAGGRARRLGGLDKGTLLYQGRSLLDRLLDLQTLCAATLVVSDDVVPGKGAPGGVVTALLRAQTPHVLIVCCDMPFVTPTSVTPLLERSPSCFADQPFPGLYPQRLGQEWRARLEHNPSMSELIAGFHRVPLADAKVVRSVNSREDAVSLGVDIP
ncbi:MAG: NTP transferase domain-containing protein [Archangiaceae bacterium]|nr:NTP transferase domain-containing protein [Archangiaceae bacterium]